MNATEAASTDGEEAGRDPAAVEGVVTGATDMETAIMRGLTAMKHDLQTDERMTADTVKTTEGTATAERGEMSTTRQSIVTPTTTADPETTATGAARAPDASRNAGSVDQGLIASPHR